MPEGKLKVPESFRQKRAFGQMPEGSFGPTLTLDEGLNCTNLDNFTVACVNQRAKISTVF